MNKTEMIKFRVTPEERAHMEKAAAAAGKTISDVAREAMFSGHQMPKEIWDILNRSAEAMRLPVSVLVAHKLIRIFALQIASHEVYGSTKNCWTDIYFQDTSDGLRMLVTGEQLFFELKDYYTKLFREYNANMKTLVEASGIHVDAEEYSEFVDAI